METLSPVVLEASLEALIMLTCSGFILYVVTWETLSNKELILSLLYVLLVEVYKCSRNFMKFLEI